MTASLLPALTVEEVAIDLLRPDPANPRRISDDELDALERSLRQFGFVSPVLARREDRTVIGGHQRLVAARRLGLTTVPVTWLDVSVEQARLLGLALNRISGTFDDALLARLLADLQATPDLDLSLSGFGEDEIKDLLRSLETREKREQVESFDLDAALEEARRAPRTKPGELWVLGDHRLLCGDATRADLVSDAVEQTVSESVRATVEKVAELTIGGGETTVVQVAARLGIDKSSASRRVIAALERGYLRNLEDRRGRPSRLVLGDPLPLRNPLYNGWIRRHRGADETRRPAAWRANPPVSDELWARVEDVRRSKAQGGGPRRSGHLDLLAGLLECVCGRRLRSDGTFGDGRHRKLHPEPCEAWGPQARYGDETWEVPVLAQVAGLTLDDGVIARVVAALGSPDRPVGLERARIERQMRDLALDHVAERIADSAYLERLGRLRVDRATVDAIPRGDLLAKRAVEWLRVLADTWVNADVPEARAELLHAIYERIVVVGRSIVTARLTPAAYSNGLALALPQVVMARPEGAGRALAAYRMPIEGRDEWVAAAARLA